MAPRLMRSLASPHSMTTSSSLISMMRPIRPLLVITWSPRFSSASICLWALARFCWGRISRNQKMANIRIRGTNCISMSPPLGAAPPAWGVPMAKATDSNNKTNLQRDAVGRPLSMRDARGNKFSARKHTLPQKNLQALLLSGKNVLRTAGVTVKNMPAGALRSEKIAAAGPI